MLNLLKLFIVIINLINNIDAQGLEIPKTPCKTVFNYKVRTGSNTVYGYLKFANDYSGDYQLEVRMSVARRTSEKLRIIRIPTEESIQCGEDLEYEVIFPPCEDLIPVLTFVKFNNKIYCTGSQDIHDRVATQLKEYDALVTEIVQMPCLQEVTTERVKGETETTPTTERAKVELETPPTRINNGLTTETPSIVRTKVPSVSTCGVIHKESGKNGREHFPWLATLYYSSNGQDPTYRCSGALISNKYVVTVAHCVINIQRENLTIRVGSNSIKKIIPPSTTTIRQVKTITIHSEYDLNQGYLKGNNIAIIELEAPVVFNDLVNPACLWMGSDDLEEAIGKESIAIGYDKDAKPKKFSMPVVSQMVCMASHKTYADILGNTSFCAGNRDGIVPCIGNSGGSLLIKQPDGKYYLRGLVSLAVTDKDSKCDGSQYVMFTDVAKFGTWISSILNS